MALVNPLLHNDIHLLACGVAVYFILLFVLHWSMKYMFRSFYGSLHQRLGTYKTLSLLIFVLGVTITIASTPFCAYAFISSSHTNETLGHSASASGKICLGTRAVLWTAELPLLGGTHFYFVHHALSLMSLSIVGLKGLDIRPLYMIYAGLATEVFSSSRAFIRCAGLHHTSPKLFSRITFANAISLLPLRAIPAIYIMYKELSSTIFSSKLGLAYFASVGFYGAFVTYMAYKLLSGLGCMSFQLAAPARFLFPYKTHSRQVSVYSLFLGLAMAATKLSTASLYELASSKPLPGKERFNLIILGAGTVIAGLFGAKVMNRTLCVSAKSAVEELAPVANLEVRRVFPWFKGISIQGAILFSALWLFVSQSLALEVNNRLLLGAVGVSLPLGEAIGRVGCFFAGCCGSKRKDKYPNLQLLAATLNLAIFIGRLVYLANNGISEICETGVVAVLANGAVRLAINSLRRDSANMEFSPASVFAAAQVLFLSGLLALEKAGNGMSPAASLLAALGVACTSLVMCRIATQVWALTARFLQNHKISRFATLENIVYVFSASIFILVANSDAGDEFARTGEFFLSKEPLLLMSSPALWCSAAFAAGLPVLLLN